VLGGDQWSTIARASPHLHEERGEECEGLEQVLCMRHIMTTSIIMMRSTEK
jgi:hypothetical protein